MPYRIKPGERSSIAATFLAAVVALGPACGADDAADGGTSPGTGGSASAASGPSGAGGASKAGGSGAEAGQMIVPEVEPHPDCSLTGKWISVQRTLSVAVVSREQVKQSAHSWGYWEFEQNGVEAVAVKGLRCGFQVVSRSTTIPVNITVSRAIWDADTTRSSNNGRSATYGATGDGCYLHIERRYVVRGATVDYFMDPSADLEEAQTQASEIVPGWEDWDGDGHPGITFTVSGLASGELYLALREWHEYRGTTPRGAQKFEVGMIWNTEQVTLGKDREGLSSADTISSVEPSENFIWFVRVDGLEQWDVAEDTDDLAVCVRVRELKDQLLPEGNR